MPRPPRLHIPVAAIKSCYGAIIVAIIRQCRGRLVLNDIVVDVLGRFDTRIHAF